MYAPVRVKDISVVMIGNSGHGISATGNTILNKEIFVESRGPFSNTPCAQAASAELGARKIVVMDTPGVQQNAESKTAVLKEVNRMAFLLEKRVNCIIIVSNASVTRGGDQFLDLLDSMQGSFKDKITDYCLLVYTHSDAADTATGFLEGKRSDKRMAKLLDAISNRVVFIENSGPYTAKTREVLVEEINGIVERNPNGLTNDRFTKSAKLKEILTKKTSGSGNLIFAATEACMDCSWWHYLSMDQEGFKQKVQKILERSSTHYDDRFNVDVGTIYKELYQVGFARVRRFVLPCVVGATTVFVVYYYRDVIRIALVSIQ